MADTAYECNRDISPITSILVCRSAGKEAVLYQTVMENHEKWMELCALLSIE
jgi:hypothetical protein